MKKILALLLAVLMITAIFAGCAKTQTPDTTEPQTVEPTEQTTEQTAEQPSDEHEAVTLSVWYYDDPGVSDVMDAWAQAVQSAYSWITLKFEALPYDSGPEKFTVACATGTTPDIYIDGYSRIAPAVYAGLTVDLKELVDTHQDAFLGKQEEGLVDGKLGYISHSTDSAYAVLVNMDLAERLGVADMLPADYESWSYDDYLAICRKAKEEDPSIIPAGLFAGSQSSDAWYYTWLLANGSKLTDEALTKTVFNSDEYRDTTLETLNFFKTLIDENLVPDGCATQTDENVASLFMAGQLLFVHGGYNSLPYFYGFQKEGSSMEFTMDAYAVPTSSGKAGPSANWGTFGFCGFDNNGHAEDIKRTIGVWLEHPEIQSAYSSVTGRLPQLAGTNVQYETEHITEVMDRATVFSAEHNTSDFGILEPWWSDFRQTFYPQLQDFYTGAIDAQTMLNNWQSAADAVIAAAAK